MQVRSGGGEAALSISENQHAITHDEPGSVEAEQNESVKRVPAAAKWGMAGLLLVYGGLGTYALVTTVDSNTGPGHPEGVTRSVAAALGKSAAPSGAPASGTSDLWGQLANIKSASGAAAAMAAGPPQPAAPANEVLTAVSATAIGPDGASDGDHPDLAALAVDPHSAMSWVTHWYKTAYFGNLQDGTGLLLDMGRTVTIKQFELALAGSPGFWGANVQIRIGDTPDLAGLAPVATANDVGGWVTADLHASVTGRYVQIWFTKLPLDQQGTYQEHVYGITVHGSAPRPSHSSASRINTHTTSQTVGQSRDTHSGSSHGGYRGGGHGNSGHGNSGGHDGGPRGHGGGFHGGGRPSLGIRCRVEPSAGTRCR
ncbi:MAG: serine/threonine protein kinase [Actinomycetia bacterium]|nr:serine/threonine protein kinase [Actinomycetes bacterium]